MKPPRPPKARVVREPVQVYLAGDDSALLASLSAESGLSKAEVLRRGLRSFARAQGGNGPMLRLLDAADGADWDGPLGPDLDAALAESYRGAGKPAAKRR
jgi:hypothetical protein